MNHAWNGEDGQMVTVNQNIEVVAKSSRDVDLARKARDEIRPVLEEVARIMNDYQVHGLVIGFAFGSDQFGRRFVGEISVARPL